jgi:hypothetical protein
MATARRSKLVELRRRTDRDLVILVERELNRGLTVAEVATTKESPLYAQAESAYEMVKTWLPLLSGLNRDERRELELKLKELSSALNRLAAETKKRLASASAI